MFKKFNFTVAVLNLAACIALFILNVSGINRSAQLIAGAVILSVMIALSVVWIILYRKEHKEINKDNWS